MKKEIKIGVIGGDTRQLEAAYALCEQGFRAVCFGVPQKEGKYGAIERSSDLDGAVKGASAVLLGLPFTRDGRHINMGDGENDILISRLLSLMSPGQLLLGGKLPASFYESAREHSIEAIDYLQVESLSVANAVPTAEGALAVAMNELDITLHGARALVIGYGRVGKVLSKLLYALGSRVTVAARRSSVGAWCQVEGFDFMPTSKLCLSGFDVIFNTVPFPLLTGELLGSAEDEGLIVDLASSPGGVDMTAAREQGKRVIRALSLPGKVAPRTAGKIIKDTVLEILSGEGII